MPRKPSLKPNQLLDRALRFFWTYGYHAASMDDLVRATVTSRHGIYTAFGGKKALFLACFDRYQETVVTPAFGVVEGPGANLQTVALYYEHLIAQGDAARLPGPGCFVVNSATEMAPHDADVMAKVDHHNTRLRKGFANAVHNSAAALDRGRAAELAEVMVVFTAGLWTLSRSVDEAETLRRTVRRFLHLIADGIA